MAEEGKQTTEKTPAKGKKAKPPALEDKPFQEFMEKDFTPSLENAFAKEGIKDLQLTFAKKPIPMDGFSQGETYWQVEGIWQGGDRQFNLYYFDEDIKGAKGFSYSTDGTKPSTLESFMIDERKVTLDLMVLYTVQRINGEKWFGRN